jgi:hypothetical protein
MARAQSHPGRRIALVGSSDEEVPMRRRRFVLLVTAIATGALAAGLAVGIAIGADSAQSERSKPWFSVLRGSNEIGADGRRGAGDRNGRGAFSGLLDGNRLCYGVQVAGIEEATLAHVHRGAPNRNGPPVVNLEPPADGASSDCVEIDAALARSIARNPSRFCVNVHNADFPGGAVRGQVFTQPRR